MATTGLPSHGVFATRQLERLRNAIDALGDAPAVEAPRGHAYSWPYTTFINGARHVEGDPVVPSAGRTLEQLVDDTIGAAKMWRSALSGYQRVEWCEAPTLEHNKDDGMTLRIRLAFVECSGPSRTIAEAVEAGAQEKVGEFAEAKPRLGVVAPGRYGMAQNGEAIMGGTMDTQPLNAANLVHLGRTPDPHLVAELEQLLAMARAGEMRGFAYVCLRPGGMVGSNWCVAPDASMHCMNSGAHILAQRLVEAMRGDCTESTEGPYPEGDGGEAPK